jgi:eukaryotic-like serine/threonine-protein kinase
VEAESPPRVLADRYELGPVIGHGGMGEVRRGRDLRLGREVAIKLLRLDLAVQEEVRRRFEHEARAAAQLGHPNVVTVFDSGEIDGQPYIVMECLPGRTLADELAEGALSPERIDAVARDVLAALGAAHRQGIVHRDVKPGNLLIADDGSIKVTDFGIAKSADVLDPTLTGQILGTPAYVAPERLEGRPATAQSDLYGCGVVLYEAVAGKRPFAGDSPMAVARSVQQDTPEPLVRARADVAPATAAAIERAMAKDPERRFGSAEEMAEAFGVAASAVADDVTEIISVPVHGDPTTEVFAAPEPATRVAGREPPLTRPRRSRSVSGPMIAVLVALATVMLVLALRAASDGDRDNPSPTTVSPTAGVPTPPTEGPASELPAPLDDAIDTLERLVQP